MNGAELARDALGNGGRAALVVNGRQPCCQGDNLEVVERRPVHGEGALAGLELGDFTRAACLVCGRNHYTLHAGPALAAVLVKAKP